MLKPANIRALIHRVRAWNDAGPVFRNSGWLIADNLARMALTLGISAAMARGLGAEDLGALKATFALVTLCSSFTNLGLYGIVVKALARDPDNAPDTLGTTAVLYVIGSFVSVGICLAVGLTRIDEPDKLLLVLIFTLGVMFHAPRIANLWFQYQVRSAVTVWAKAVPSIVSGVGILVAAILQAPVWVFAILLVSDTILGALALTALCAVEKTVPKNLVFRWSTARDLLAQSWPLVAASVAVKIYLKVDQLMLERMIDDTAVGIYSVAADLSEIWYILPTALATSALSGIVTLYVTDEAAYRERIQDLLDLMVLVAGGIVLVVFLIAPYLMPLVYGEDFAAAGPILRVHIFAAPFIFMGSVLSKSIVTEGYYRFSFVRHSCGAIVNVALNLWLIPRYGGLGAAWATVVSYATAAYFSTLLHPMARRMFRQMTRALALPFR